MYGNGVVWGSGPSQVPCALWGAGPAVGAWTTTGGRRVGLRLMAGGATTSAAGPGSAGGAAAAEGHAAAAVVASARALVGRAVRAVLADGSEVESQLLAVGGDGGAPDIAVFRRQPEHTYAKADYVLVPLSSLRAIEAHGATKPTPSLRVLTEAEAAKRLDAALDEARRKAATRGRGVTATAQSLFDFVNKQLRMPHAATMGGTVAVGVEMLDGMCIASPCPIRPRAGWLRRGCSSTSSSQAQSSSSRHTGRRTPTAMSSSTATSPM